MKKILLFLSVMMAVGTNAQDINFSQFYELPLLRNPALAGDFRGDIRITSAFRTQWSSVTVPYQTQGLGAEIKLSGQNSDTYVSAGLQVTNDVAGDSKLGKTQVFPMAAVHVPVGRGNSYFTAGFLGGIVQQRFDPSKLSFDDQFVNGAYNATNPTRQNFSNTNVTYFDLAGGLKFSSITGEDTRYYLGVGAFHVSGKTKVAFDQTRDILLNRKYTFNGGISFPTGDADRVILYLDCFFQGGNSQGQGGILYKHDFVKEDDDFSVSMAVGGMLRWNDAVIPVIKLDYYNWSAGLTYDVNISKLVKASGARGGFELTLAYSNFLNILNSSLTKTRCPANVY